MAASRSPIQLAEIAALLISKLYELGGYATWKEFADDAHLSTSQISDFQRAKVEPSGYNLLSLIQAAARRAELEEAEAAARSTGGWAKTIADRLSEVAEGVERTERAVLDLLAAQAPPQEEHPSAQAAPTPKEPR